LYLNKTRTAESIDLWSNHGQSRCK